MTGGNCVGGIAGNGVGTIKNCYALADVTAAGDSAGGIAGYAYNLSIENCYYSGKVSSMVMQAALQELQGTAKSKTAFLWQKE